MLKPKLKVWQIPTLVVSKELFKQAKYSTYIRLPHYKYHRKMPSFGYEIAEDKIAYIDIKPTVTFRKKFSLEKVTREIQYMDLTQEDRWTAYYTIIFK